MSCKPADTRVCDDGIWRDLRVEAGGLRDRPVLFLDRDGVIVEEVTYLHRPGDVRLIDGVVGLITRASQAGAGVVVVTNQSGVGRGLYGWSDLAAVEDEIARQLGDDKAAVQAVFACPFHADARPPFDSADHPARKPNPGMLLMTADLLGADLARSWIIGDRATDLMAASRAGLAGGLLLGEGYDEGEAERALSLAGDQFQARRIERLDEADEHIAWLGASA
ncbi:MAG: HAD-IIIA family hydrolase [Pseudomonadota bacterium]